MRFVFLFILLFYVNVTFSQEATSLEVGIGYRLTPINLNISETNTSGVYFDRDKQLSGFSPFLGVSYVTPRNLILDVRIYGRYDHLYYKRNNGVSSNEEVKRILSDIVIEIDKRFRMKKSNSFCKIGLGYGLMNNGSNYSYSVIDGFDSAGNPIYFTQSSSFKFATINLNFEYQVNNHCLFLKPFYTLTPYKNNDKLILLELGYSYQININHQSKR